jgi:hypothetical protein
VPVVVEPVLLEEERMMGFVVGINAIAVGRIEPDIRVVAEVLHSMAMMVMTMAAVPALVTGVRG